MPGPRVDELGGRGIPYVTTPTWTKLWQDQPGDMSAMKLGKKDTKKTSTTPIKCRDCRREVKDTGGKFLQCKCGMIIRTEELNARLNPSVPKGGGPKRSDPGRGSSKGRSNPKNRRGASKPTRKGKRR